jgi:hypothetical protein
VKAALQISLARFKGPPIISLDSKRAPWTGPPIMTCLPADAEK